MKHISYLPNDELNCEQHTAWDCRRRDETVTEDDINEWKKRKKELERNNYE